MKSDIHDLIQTCDLIPSEDTTRRILEICQALNEQKADGVIIIPKRKSVPTDVPRIEAGEGWRLLDLVTERIIDGDECRYRGPRFATDHWSPATIRGLADLRYRDDFYYRRRIVQTEHRGPVRKDDGFKHPNRK